MLQKVASILLLIGGLNWGLVGALNMNIVEMILQNSTLISIVYVLVGLAAIYEIVERLRKS